MSPVFTESRLPGFTRPVIDDVGAEYAGGVYEGVGAFAVGIDTLPDLYVLLKFTGAGFFAVRRPGVNVLEIA
jgi:hypothetical protein